jgi:hypothetical protein
MNEIRWDRMIAWILQFAGGPLLQQRQRESGLTIHEFLRREVEERQRMRAEEAARSSGCYQPWR